jgi:restriction endonuclease Mrr
MWHTVRQGAHALLMSLGTFTNQAKHFDNSFTKLSLIDGDQLVRLVFNRHGQLG